MEDKIYRELTRAELAAIRKLVKDLCANYDHEYGCLPLDGDCYMFYGVAYTNTGMCKYFRNAVLPTEPILEAVLNGREIPNTEKCAVCDTSFIPDGKQRYCSPDCQNEGNRIKSRERMKRKRHKDKG